MSEQKYFLAGLDLSAETTLSQEQIMQAINGMEPLANIGVIVVGTTRPDITNNPEMINSLWLDYGAALDSDGNAGTPAGSTSAPVVRRYCANRSVLVDADTSWKVAGVAPGSITTAMISSRSSTGGVDLTKLKVNSGYTDSGNYYYVLRIAANGKDIEAVSLDTALADGGGVGFGRIATTGQGTGKYLKTVAGALAYGYIDPTVDINSTFGNRIALATSIAPGTALYLARTNAAGTAPEWITPTDATLMFNPSQLNQQSAATNDILRWSGSAWAKVTPSLELVGGSSINNGSTSANDLTTAVHTFAHGLGAVNPKNIEVRLICTSAELGYSVNDEIPSSAVRDNNAGNGPAITYASDATNITVLNSSTGAGTPQIPNKGTAVFATLDETKWKPKVYAWK